MGLVDITEKFFSAAGKLSYGEVVCLDSFNYFDSMSAIELNDPKLDSGKVLLDVPPLKAAVDQGAIPRPSSLTQNQLLQFLDQQLKHVGMWLEGQSLPHTTYSCVYYYLPQVVEEHVLVSAALQFYVFLAEKLHGLIHYSTILREDDYAYAPIKFPEFEVQDEVLDRNLQNSEKMHSDNEAILLRVKFMRSLYFLVKEVTKDSEVNLEAFKNQAQSAKKQLQTILETQDPSEVPNVFDDKYSLLRLSHFLPNKIYKAEEYTNSQALNRIDKFITCTEEIVSLSGIKDLDYLFKAVESLSSYDVFSRVLCEMHLFHWSEPNFLSNLIVNSMIKNEVEVEFMKKYEEFNLYLSRVDIVCKELILLRLKNSTRHRRIQAKYFSDLNILINEADFVETHIYGRNRQGFEKQALFNWIFIKVIKCMIEFLELGFPLELYSLEDIGMVMFYLDFLYGALINGYSALFKHLDSKSAKKRRKKTNLKEVEHQLKKVQALQVICRGMVRVYVLLDSQNLLPALETDLETARFKKRFQPFQQLQVPQPLDYSSYSSIKNLKDSMTRNQMAEAARECMETARTQLNALTDVKELLRTCVRNSLALTKAEKSQWKVTPSFARTEHPVYPVWILD